MDVSCSNCRFYELKLIKRQLTKYCHKYHHIFYYPYGMNNTPLYSTCFSPNKVKENQYRREMGWGNAWLKQLRKKEKEK